MMPLMLFAAFWGVAWIAASQCIAFIGGKHLSFLEHRSLTLLGMIIFPMMITYGLAHLFPVRTAVRMTFIILSICAIFLLWKRGAVSVGLLKDEPPVWVKRACIAMIVAVTPFFLRSLVSDSGTWNRYPVAKTIAEGNVPVHTPVEPDQIFSYHFGPEFFDGIVHAFSGISLPFAYSVILLLCFISTIYTGLALLRRWGASWNVAFLGGFFVIFAGGFVWLNAAYFLNDLFRHFLLHVPMAYPFARLSWLFVGGSEAAAIMNFTQPSMGFGMPVLLGCLLIFSFFEEKHPRAVQWMLSVFLIASLCALELYTESSLVIVIAALFGTAIWFSLPKKRTAQAFSLFHSSILWIALLVAMGISVIQGGILSDTFFHLIRPSLNAQTMGSLHFNPKAVCFAWSSPATDDLNPCFNVFVFIRDFGVFLFVQLLCWILIFRRKSMQPSFVTLTLAAFFFFALPFFFTHPILTRDIRRLWHVHLFLMALVLPLVLQQTGFAKNLLRKIWLRNSLILALCASGFFYLVAHTLIPDMRFHKQPLLASLTVPTAEESKLYDWVLKHTTQRDYFFQYTSRNYYFPQVTSDSRYMLMVNTGRFSVGPHSLWAYDPAWMGDVFAFGEQCNLSLAHRLHIHDLLLEGIDHQDWFQSHCKLSDWAVVYRGGDASNPITVLNATH